MVGVEKPLYDTHESFPIQQRERKVVEPVK